MQKDASLYHACCQILVRLIITLPASLCSTVFILPIRGYLTYIYLFINPPPTSFRPVAKDPPSINRRRQSSVVNRSLLLSNRNDDDDGWDAGDVTCCVWRNHQLVSCSSQLPQHLCSTPVEHGAVQLICLISSPRQPFFFIY